QYVDTFVYKLGLRQTIQDKHDQIVQMKLTTAEWKRVGLFASLLAHADMAQQSFSSDTGPSLHLALPALESLHKAWDSCSTQSKYEGFSLGLDAAVEKIGEYYEKSADSEAYTITNFILVLDPSLKVAHFKKHWGADLHAEVIQHAELIFKAHHLEIYGEDGTSALPKKIASRIGQLLWEISSDEDVSGDVDEVEGQSPWLKEFNLYLN
ncbi:hypothetical protein PAXRUDRAFT_108336, partial [Paxillus rubicundulus Ve08.2h10]